MIDTEDKLNLDEFKLLAGLVDNKIDGLAARSKTDLKGERYLVWTRIYGKIHRLRRHIVEELGNGQTKKDSNPSGLPNRRTDR